jgi:hypothetical protein
VTIAKGMVDRGTSLAAGEDRRRSQRVVIRVPVTLELAASDQVSRIAASTVAVNIHGAMVICETMLESGTRLVIRNDRTQERASARVTRTPRQSSEGFLIPLEFDKPLPMFWQISFPPENWKASDV